MSNNSPTIISPRFRAIGATIIFGAFGILGIVIALPNFDNAWPLILFYGLLVWNDYFSVEHFSKMIPGHKLSQILIDAMLVILHFLLIFLFNYPQYFSVVMTILFTLATFKYAYDLPVVEKPERLFRKIRIDALGAFSSALAAAGMLFGYPWSSTLVWTAIFLGATIYVIFINPLYKPTIGTT